MLVQLAAALCRKIATPDAIKQYYEGLGGHTVCRCECSAYCDTHDRDENHPHDMGLCYAGLMRKYKEGQRKLREATRKRKAGQDDARDPASCY